MLMSWIKPPKRVPMAWGESRVKVPGGVPGGGDGSPIGKSAFPAHTVFQGHRTRAAKEASDQLKPTGKTMGSTVGWRLSPSTWMP